MRHRGQIIPVILVVLGTAGLLFAQPVANTVSLRSAWRHIGNAAVDLALASVATGPVERVWYAADGTQLYIRTHSGQLFKTGDLEHWSAVMPGAVEPPPVDERTAQEVPNRPEAERDVRVIRGDSATFYALGRAVYRSDDGGLNWSNLSDYHRQSILGGGLTDLAVSPRNRDEIVVAGRFGLWRSVDGGLSWSGLNESLPNLPLRRILDLPADGRGARVAAEGFGVVEWAPGERTAWRPVSDNELAREEAWKSLLAGKLGIRPLAVAASGQSIYAGAGEGRLWSSQDGGKTWNPFHVPGAGTVERIYVLPGEPAVALAAVGRNPKDGAGIHVLRTTNGGMFWDDLTSNLPDVAAHGITADAKTGAVYVATEAGVFFTIADLLAAGPPDNWVRLASLPDGVAFDVRLDEAANQLYAAVQGRGLFATMAPHRFLAPAAVNAADLRTGPAAPGGLLSVLGKEIRSARAGSFDVPVLASSQGESQIQIPYEVTGEILSLGFWADGSRGKPRRYELPLPLRATAPAIFVDRDGTPMLFDADSGVLLDAMTPAGPGSRIQVLATGLGKVDPAWPTGMPAPLENTPRVVAPVRIFLDRVPVEATRATLAPGYIGFYVIEFYVPDIVNAGPAELYIEVGGETSNRTRIYLEP